MLVGLTRLNTDDKKYMARKQTNNDLPTFDALLVPTITALQELGGQKHLNIFMQGESRLLEV